MNIFTRIGSAGALAAAVALSLSAVPAYAAMPAEGEHQAAVGECFSYSLDAMSGVWAMADTPVPCNQSHTAETILIAVSTDVTSLPPVGKLTKEQLAAFPSNIHNDSAVCRDAVDKKVGSKVSRYGTNILYQASADGSVTLRCDMILYNPKGSNILALPANPRGVDVPWCGLLKKGKILSVKCGSKGSAVMYDRGYLNEDRQQKYPGSQKKVRNIVSQMCPERGIFSYPGKKTAWKAGGYYACYAY